MGRFINADGLVASGQEFLGNNMFAYCRNNPVRFVDVFGAYAVDAYDEDGKPLSSEDIENLSGGGGGGNPFSFGFSSFGQLKNFLGSAGKGNHWHHIVEQSQIEKSGFSPEQVHNTGNVISVDQATHARITGHYNTTTFEFTNGLSVRNYLAGQSFAVQYDYGMNVLREFGVIK